MVLRRENGFPAIILCWKFWSKAQKAKISYDLYAYRKISTLTLVRTMVHAIRENSFFFQKMCPLIVSTFSWGRKSCPYFGKCAYLGKCAYFGKWRISHLTYSVNGHSESLQLIPENEDRKFPKKNSNSVLNYTI